MAQYSLYHLYDLVHKGGVYPHQWELYREIRISNI
jgi:hypothetical protein